MFELAKNGIGEVGDMVSSKMNGCRGIWLPGCTGLLEPGLGLYSRNGKSWNVPKWWIKDLGDSILDMELFAGSFRETVSIVRRKNGNWKNVKGYVFASPRRSVVNKIWTFKGRSCRVKVNGNDGPIRNWDSYQWLLTKDLPPWIVILKQSIYEGNIDELMESEEEGLIFKKPNGTYTPGRSIIKHKRKMIGTGEVIGQNPGKGRLRGMMGSLIIRHFNGTKDVVFNLSGFSDANRLVNWTGRIVKFRFMQYSDHGVPKEARIMDQD